MTADGRVDALVRAAGQGLRMGGRPKAFIELAGRPLLAWALEAVAPVVDRVLVAVPPGMEEEAQLVCGDRALVLTGGAVRLASTAILARRSHAEHVLLHDVAHPLATTDLVASVLAAAIDGDAAAPVLPVTAYLYGRDGRRMLPPGAAGMIQNPFGIRRSILLELLAELRDDPSGSIPDALVASGRTWTQVPGDPANLKVTYPADLELAERLARGAG